MEFPVVKIMLAQSLKSVRKDQFFDRWSWRGRECDGRNRGRGQRFIDVRRSGCWRQGRRGWLTRGDENNKKKRSTPQSGSVDKQACALFHIPIVSRRINRSENSPAEESSGLARVQMIYLVRGSPKVVMWSYSQESPTSCHSDSKPYQKVGRRIESPSRAWETRDQKRALCHLNQQ